MIFFEPIPDAPDSDFPEQFPNRTPPWIAEREVKYPDTF